MGGEYIYGAPRPAHTIKLFSRRSHQRLRKTKHTFTWTGRLNTTLVDNGLANTLVCVLNLDRPYDPLGVVGTSFTSAATSADWRMIMDNIYSRCTPYATRISIDTECDLLYAGGVERSAQGKHTIMLAPYDASSGETAPSIARHDWDSVVPHNHFAKLRQSSGKGSSWVEKASIYYHFKKKKFLDVVGMGLEDPDYDSTTHLFYPNSIITTGGSDLPPESLCNMGVYIRNWNEWNTSSDPQYQLVCKIAYDCILEDPLGPEFDDPALGMLEGAPLLDARFLPRRAAKSGLSVEDRIARLEAAKDADAGGATGGGRSPPPCY